jgi:hypothetical protein
MPNTHKLYVLRHRINIVFLYVPHIFTCSILASKLLGLDKFLLYTVTDRNIAFSGTPSTGTPKVLNSFLGVP